MAAGVVVVVVVVAGVEVDSGEGIGAVVFIVFWSVEDEGEDEGGREYVASATSAREERKPKQNAFTRAGCIVGGR